MGNSSNSSDSTSATSGKKARVSHLATLFDALKSYRDIHYDEPVGSFPNGLLYQIALKAPADSNTMESILGGRKVGSEVVRDLLDLVRLYSRALSGSDRSSIAREKLERLELSLHRLVVNRLKGLYHEGWWYEGVPEKIRLKAACLHEESGGTIEKETALYLVDFKEIILGRWGDFKEIVADPQSSKREFESDFGILLELRNRLSHPIRLKDNPVSDETIDYLDRWLKEIEER